MATTQPRAQFKNGGKAERIRSVLASMETADLSDMKLILKTMADRAKLVPGRNCSTTEIYKFRKLEAAKRGIVVTKTNRTGNGKPTRVKLDMTGDELSAVLTAIKSVGSAKRLVEVLNDLKQLF